MNPDPSYIPECIVPVCVVDPGSVASFREGTVTHEMQRGQLVERIRTLERLFVGVCGQARNAGCVLGPEAKTLYEALSKRSPAEAKLLIRSRFDAAEIEYLEAALNIKLSV